MKLEDDNPVKLEDIRNYIKEKDIKCEWCKNSFDSNDIDMYPHSGGYNVDGMNDKQWLYITCRHCGYDWAL